MDNREKGYTLWKKGLKYKEIADKLGVPVSTVKSWATRYWKKEQDASKKVATKKEKVATKDASKQTSKHKGGQPGNVNSVGNKGGAPPGNDNATTHGGYSKLLADHLTEDEQEYYDNDEEVEDEERTYQQEIRLLNIRIARLMKMMKEMEEKPGNLYVDMVSTSERKRKFDSKEDKELYDELIHEEIDKGDRKPGTDYHVSTRTQSTANFILAIHEAINRAQAQKQRNIDALVKLREARKAENPTTDIEDLRDLRKAVFGDYPK